MARSAFLAATGCRASDPKKLAFFTGRDQSQALTGWWASQFGTPNYAAHGGFCSVNMAAGGIYSIGGSFWEFGEPDWELTRYCLIFGVAEDHDSNPIKIGIGKLKTNGAKVIGVNPVWDPPREMVLESPSRNSIMPIVAEAPPPTVQQRGTRCPARNGPVMSLVMVRVPGSSLAQGTSTATSSQPTCPASSNAWTRVGANR